MGQFLRQSVGATRECEQKWLKAAQFIAKCEIWMKYSDFSIRTSLHLIRLLVI